MRLLEKQVTKMDVEIQCMRDEQTDNMKERKRKKESGWVDGWMGMKEIKVVWTDIFKKARAINIQTRKKEEQIAMKEERQTDELTGKNKLLEKWIWKSNEQTD